MMDDDGTEFDEWDESDWLDGGCDEDCCTVSHHGVDCICCERIV